MPDFLNYHRSIKKNQHIFLYCVCGRSSSTAFQRILNSSNEVLIWGESHGLIDAQLNLINHVRKLIKSDDVNESLRMLNECIEQNKHLAFYPNAIGNLTSTLELLESSISNLLNTGRTNIQRFGFKEISTRSLQNLESLREIYPQSTFMFCFRDPVKQWPSISTLNWWANVNELEKFLNEYCRIANIYLNFSLKNNINSFIENSDLRNSSKIDHIIKNMHISTIDADLIDVTVNTAHSDEISSTIQDKILSSEAYQCYLKMKKKSNSFYDTTG